jgi:hypothetical protein
MRKANILAIATAVLAVVNVITGLIRGDVAANGDKLSAAPAAQHLLTAGGLKARSFDAI